MPCSTLLFFAFFLFASRCLAVTATLRCHCSTLYRKNQVALLRLRGQYAGEGFMEQIYTIPINEVFEQTKGEQTLGCPLCLLRARLEENELELILGASMMEPDIRIRTNREGFCRRHYSKMLERKNRLGLGLILESHLEEVEKGLSEGLLGLLPGKKGEGPLKYLSRLEKSCYICGRIEGHFARMCANLAEMYRVDASFREKFVGQPYFCLPHTEAVAKAAKTALPAKEYRAFWDAVAAVNERYLAALRKDVSWFCKKFDYRYENEPWNGAKDAVIRAAAFLRGKDD